jgi:thiopurine S-methyltransferase
MKKDFWLERWEKEEIGFHQNEINPYLRQYWPELRLIQGTKAFVPLCGKSHDMLWLREQGHSVLGVELSDIAVQAFFLEHKLSPRILKSEPFERHEADDIHILCGDFFALEKAHLAEVRAVYDRASLVALPPEMRENYVRHLMNILPFGTQILLITFDYNQAEMSGPPFAVSSAEVVSLYQNHAHIRLLAKMDVLDENPRFRQRGLSRIEENIFLLTLIEKSDRVQ